MDYRGLAFVHRAPLPRLSVGAHEEESRPMKFGIRRPSFRKSLAARTSWKRVLRHQLGLKAPRGYGWLTSPRRAEPAPAARYNCASTASGPQKNLTGSTSEPLFRPTEWDSALVLRQPPRSRLTARLRA
jgi:hypothetical protein